MELISFLTISILVLSALFALYAVVGNKSRPSNSKKNKNEEGGKWFMDWSAEQVLANPTYTVSLPSVIVTSNPLNLEHVLKTKFVNYTRGDTVTGVLFDLLGNGLLNAEGEHWKTQRRMASLQFNKNNIRNFIMDVVTQEIVTRLVPFLHKTAISGEVVNMQVVLDRFSFDIVCKIACDVDATLLAADRGDDACRNFARAYDTVADLTLRRFQQPGFLWRLRRKLKLGYERQLMEALSVVNHFSMNIVRNMKQRSGTSGGSDFLSQFIAAEGGDHSDEFLRDIVTNFVLAGRDTTSTTMMWVLWILASRPSVREKIRDEIRGVRSKHGNTDGPFSMEEVSEMVYLHAVVMETLRLYPVQPLQLRTCAADDVLPDGTRVKAGWKVVHNLLAMARMESLWGEDCRDYRPERWFDDDGALKHVSPFQFPVFLAGPMSCLGKDTAYLQIKAVVATVLERFDVERAAEDEEEMELEVAQALRMKGGFPARVRARD